VPFAAAIRAQAGVATAAVGLLTEPGQCDDVITRGDADLVMLARAMLRDDAWPIHAARTLGRPDAVRVPPQYLRAY
jgi:2,4-dienoyl-CoA reductase-like NADH-dependent reductase (Old Yellow Enzyme family)